jgi:D-alanyl-D-alanine endopeptidase (penicillin-binding protein 7)
MKYHVVGLPIFFIIMSVISFGYYAELFSYHLPPASAEIVDPVLVVASTSLTVTALAYGIFDMKTGEIIASLAIDDVYPIASVTKLFTATAILENFDPETMTTITGTDIAGEGTSGNLHLNEVYSYRELLFPLLLESSNDAALALERATDGEIVAAMHQVAKKYGTTVTEFVDASGLSAQNVSTVRDLITFSRAAAGEYPFIYDIAQLPQYIGQYTGWRNNNPLFDSRSYRGGKHGYTPAAGRTLVAQFDEEFQNGERRIGYILLGSEDLQADMLRLRTFVRDSVDY